MNSDELHSKSGAAHSLAQLRSRYELRMEEPYDRAVACHLIRRAAKDKGLQVIVVLGVSTCKSHGEVGREVCVFPTRHFGCNLRGVWRVTAKSEDIGYSPKARRVSVFMLRNDGSSGLEE